MHVFGLKKCCILDLSTFSLGQIFHQIYIALLQLKVKYLVVKCKILHNSLMPVDWKAFANFALYLCIMARMPISSTFPSLHFVHLKGSMWNWLNYEGGRIFFPNKQIKGVEEEECEFVSLLFCLHEMGSVCIGRIQDNKRRGSSNPPIGQYQPQPHSVTKTYYSDPKVHGSLSQRVLIFWTGIWFVKMLKVPKTEFSSSVLSFVLKFLLRSGAVNNWPV